MTVLIKETQGDTLVGTINGVNTDYYVTFPFEGGTVNIYVNGLLKVASWADGFTETAPNQVTLKIPLIVGDSLEVEYQSDTPTGGGAEGGCPLAPVIENTEPYLATSQSIPNVATDKLQPETGSDGENKPVILSDDLKPVIL